MDEGSCDLSDVSYLVLDEADRMLDQGFERDVRKIIAATHPHRQTCLFSATWPDTVRELAHEFLKNPMKITIGSDDLAAGSTIEQIVEIFEDERQRQWKLIEVLKKHQKSDRHKRVLIFVLYKKEATRIEQFLQGKGFNATSIQGDKSQEARQKAVDQFKAGSVPLLVATDVAARGLDIPGVDLVVNFSFPLTIEDYGNVLLIYCRNLLFCKCELCRCISHVCHSILIKNTYSSQDWKNRKSWKEGSSTYIFPKTS